jgi:hypothetical protein
MANEIVCELIVATIQTKILHRKDAHRRRRGFCLSLGGCCLSLCGSELRKDRVKKLT